MNKTKNGYYIVLEGPESVGKTTQIELVANELQRYGYMVQVFKEPDHKGHITSRAIRQITQDPNYPINTRAEVLLYNAARSLSLELIKNAQEQGIICLVDRNYLSTIAVQYYGRGDVPDYNTINTIISFAVGEMEPDLTIILDAPVDTLINRSAGRSRGDRFDNMDVAFLDRVRAGYLLEAKQRQYPVVHSNETPDKVFPKVWSCIAQLFNEDTAIKNSPKSNLSQYLSTVQSPKMKKHQPYTQKYNDGSVYPTMEGVRRLTGIVSDVESDVYTFTRSIDQVTIAAAMARLSRRGDDMRVTLLDEFVDNIGNDADLIKRVVTAYGDDSVQQLVGAHVVIENASNLLTKQIEWGRLAAYLEQSTRYIYYDKKDSNGKYRYYIPTTLHKKLHRLYVKIMDTLFNNYSEVVHAVTEYIYKTDTTPSKERDGAWKAAVRAQACDAARAMLPVATKSTVGVFASGQALESLIMRLLADDSKEARDCGQAILNESRKVMPAFLERADNPERGGATIAYRSQTRQNVRKVVSSLLKDTYSSEQQPVTLTNVFPKNELDVIPYMAYEHIALSEQETAEAIERLSYKDKIAIFSAYIGERLNRRHRPGRALERIVYSWDIVCDYGIFRDLQRHRIVNDLAWQKLSPRYGYDIPELIEKAGLSELYIDSFDKSMELFSELQRADHEIESQYATLLGHKMRWKITMNAREAMHFIELRTSPQGHPGYRKIAKMMYDTIATVHPMISEAIKFVNQGEDAALTRLAAERYTQYKLKMLDS